MYFTLIVARSFNTVNLIFSSSSSTSGSLLELAATVAVRKVEPIPPKPIGKGDVIESTPAAVTDEKNEVGTLWWKGGKIKQEKWGMGVKKWVFHSGRIQERKTNLFFSHKSPKICRNKINDLFSDVNSLIQLYLDVVFPVLRLSKSKLVFTGKVRHHREADGKTCALCSSTDWKASLNLHFHSTSSLLLLLMHLIIDAL